MKVHRGLLAALLSGSLVGSLAGAPVASAGSLTTLKVGAVPTVSIGVLEIGEQQGYFAKEGIKLDITPVDSGPQIITGLAAGQYDLAFTAYEPPLVAEAAGQKLKLVEPLAVQGKSGTNGVVLVKKSSGITGWKQLAGATLGVNAVRSALVLDVQVAIGKAGGDGSSITPVQLPFNEVGLEVNKGQIVAGAVLQPFEAAALKQYPGLKILGDPAAAAFALGTPDGGIFTTTKIASAEAKPLAQFKVAYRESVAYAKKHLTETKALGIKFTGAPVAASNLIPMPPIPSTASTVASFTPLVNAMVKYHWVTKRPDLAAFVG